MDRISYFDRYTGQIVEEPVVDERLMRWVYESGTGRMLLERFLKRRVFSEIYGWFMSSSLSKRKIKPFIEKYKIDHTIARKTLDGFKNFNDFFTRQIKHEARPYNPAPSTIVFPADGRHLGFEKIEESKLFFIKDTEFNLNKLFAQNPIAKRFIGGTLVISRLCPFDYHRFHFPYPGTPTATQLISGPLYSVHPIALKKSLQILCENQRALTLLETDALGTIGLIEVGATCVGSIVQTFKPNIPVEKFDEKGYFAFGGSTTLTLFEPGQVKLSQDLLQQTAKGYELYAHAGDHMACWCR